nr:ATP-binding protein [Aeromicrobium sp. CFBP 8757]
MRDPGTSDRLAAVATSHASGSTDDDPCTTLSLPFDTLSVRVARKRLAAELADLGFRQTFVDDAELVLAELAANGIDHGRPNARGEIDISWCVEGDLVRISVCDSGEATHLKAMEFNDHSLRGRGLAIVEHLCDSWEVQTDDGLRVTAELRHDHTFQSA